uniref:BEN domain-containing protein n=1 Tax=Parascaris equorum TaxID=6256 RepID=A0A914RYN7_PAREQ
MREGTMAQMNQAAVLNMECSEDEEEEEMVDEEDEELEDDEQFEGNDAQNCEERKPSCCTFKGRLRHNLFSFQVTLLMNALHVPACKCEICEPRYRSQVELFSKMKDASAVGTHAAQNVEQKPERKKTETTENGHAEQQVNLLSAASVPPPSHASLFAGMPNMNDCEALLSQIFTQSGVNTFNSASLAGLAQALGLNNATSKCILGAASCTFLAGKRKKEAINFTKPQIKVYLELLRLNNITATGDTAGATLPTQMQSTMSVDSPGTASGDDLENSNGDWTTSQPPTQSNPAVASVNEMFKQMEQHQKQNPAHSSGSPGFLRGRGRGRPKLIGDELDAELVDYMVQVCIDLTLSYRLVVTCSERVLFLGGSHDTPVLNPLRTMSGSAANLPGGNFMADMMAQNILSQHMTQIMNQAVTGTVSATPQIVNVRELELPKHDDNVEKGEIVCGNEFKQENIVIKADENDSQYDDGMEGQTHDDDSESGVHLNEKNGVQQLFIPTNAF